MGAFKEIDINNLNEEQKKEVVSDIVKHIDIERLNKAMQGLCDCMKELAQVTLKGIADYIEATKDCH